MSELQDLIKQKKDIEARIRELKADEYIKQGCVKFEKKPGKEWSHPWQVAALSNYMMLGWNENNHKRIEQMRWFPFVRAKTRKEAIAGMRQVLDDLLDVYNRALQNTEDEDNE